MGGRVSTLSITEREMMDVASFTTNPNDSKNSRMYTGHLQILTGKSGKSHGAKLNYDVIGDIMKLNIGSSDSASLSSGAESPRYSEGMDAYVSLEPSPNLRFHSTPKNPRPVICGPRLSNGLHHAVPVNDNSGEGGDSAVPCMCGCDTDDCTTCEIIVTKHESVVSKKILTPSRWSRTFNESAGCSSSSAVHRPKWKIEVEMESTRVIHNAMKREPGDMFDMAFASIDAKKEMKDQSTDTEIDFSRSNSEETKESLASTSSDENKNNKKPFWSKKKKRKNTLERTSRASTLSERSSANSRHWKLWPFLKQPNGLKDVNSNAKLKESMYDEKLKYLQVAARVTRLRAVDVRATLLVETPQQRLTYAQLATKTHLFGVTLAAFFYPYPNTYVEWIESVADIIQERLELGDIMPKYAEAEVEECRVCLILSPDASVLLCKPDCTIIHDVSNIAGYPVRNTFVMEATESRETRPSTPASSTTSEPFVTIDELEEPEECQDKDEVADKSQTM